MPDLDARRPGRRLLLAGVGAALLAPVSACGVRLEDDAPRVPLVPTRSPLAGEGLLLDLTRECERLAGLAEALGTPLGAQLATLHRRQHTVLRTALLRRQVPATALDAVLSPSSPSSPTALPTSTPSPTVVPAREVGAAEGAAVADVAGFAGVDPELLTPLASLHAQRWAAATLLTGTAPAPPGAAAPASVLAALGAGPVEAADAATYLAEVGTARSTGARRERGEASVRALRALRTELRDGEDPPELGLGYPLPFPVRSGADVDRLLAEALTSLRATLGGALPTLLAADPAAALPPATRWLGGVEVEAHRWGVRLEPFPGLA